MGEHNFTKPSPEDVVEESFDQTTKARHLWWLCPACGNMKASNKRAHPYHMVPVRLANEPELVKPTWIWNGSLTKPTLSPSIRHVGVCYPGDCHYFMRDGVLDFCGDSAHELRGQKVPMKPVKVNNEPDPEPTVE